MQMMLSSYLFLLQTKPLIDKATSKRRPALVISNAANFNHKVGQFVLAMITSAANSDWPLDVEITNLDLAGLPSPLIVRMKLFTLDHKLIIRKIGILTGKDQRLVKVSLKKLIPV